MWRRFEREMDEELAFHLHSRIDEHVRRGATREEAERRARLEFGGVDKYKEQLRDLRTFGLLEDLGRDLVYAWRSLRRTPVFAATAILAIALGVAVNAGLVTLVYALVLRPLPVKDPATIRNVFMSTRGGGSRGTYGTPYFVSFAEFVFMRAQSRTADLAAVSEASLSCTCGAGGQLRAQLVSDNLLPLIGARPALGRFFTVSDTSTPGSAPVLVLRGQPDTVVAVLRARVAEADPNVTVAIKSIEQNVRFALAPLRIAAAAAAALGLIGLVLACTGLYGVVAFTISRRQREIGIRIALGAERTRLLRMILGHGLRPVVAGSIIGLLVAAAAGQLIRALLFGLSPIDPITFTSTTLALIAAATLAAIVPALTALRVDPMVALRDE